MTYAAQLEANATALRNQVLGQGPNPGGYRFGGIAVLHAVAGSSSGAQ